MDRRHGRRKPAAIAKMLGIGRRRLLLLRGKQTGRFPAPWRIVEIQSGFAVEDATGVQLGVFYGRADPNTAGHTGFLTMDEAKQMAVDFAKLPKLLNGGRIA